MVGSRAALVVAAMLAMAAPALASERLIRRTDEVGHVLALVQAPDGGLWMGTASGVRRHDGRTWQPVARDVIHGRIARLAVHPDGLLVAEEFGAAWLLPTDGAAPRRLVDDTGRGFLGPLGLAVTPSGTTWIVGVRGVWTGTPDHLRRVAVPPEMIEEVPRLVTVAVDGRAFVATRCGLWRLAAGGVAERLSDTPPPAALLVDDEGVLHLAWSGALTRWRDGVLAPVFALDPATTRARRGIALARRGATLWVSYDLALVALRPGRAPEILAAADGIPGGGPLLVDDEGSLWLGTFRGLRQLPEPETVAFAEADGMPSAHGRFVALTAEGAWLATWQGLALVRPGATRAAAMDPADAVVRAPLCVDGAGRLWSGAGRRLFMRDALGTHLVDVGDVALLDCIVDGPRVWIGSDAGVFVVDGAAAAPVRVGTPPPDASGTARAEQVALDGRGRLWIARAGQVCVAPAAAAAGPRAWACLELPDVHQVDDLWATPSHAVWAATRPGGVVRVAAEDDAPLRAQVLGGSAALDSAVVASLAPSPRGGVWLAASAAPVRVVEDLAAADGWRIVERLGPWQGLVGASVTHVAEAADGGLWLASWAGLTAVPASARGGPGAAPDADLVELIVDGRALPVAPRVALPAGGNAVALRVAARSRRAPELVRYRVRIGGGAWSPPRTTAELQLLDLPSGARLIEVAASLDGDTWGRAVRLSVDVATPWFRRTWVWLAAAALVALALAALHRARVAVHVRLERQRLRIAMDLHDEMGSGLGSIGMLAGVASAGSAADPALQREVAATIATTAADLGAALGDIVGALRRGPCTLDALARQLRARATAVFPASRVALQLELEGLPPVALSAAVARAAQLVGHEAMHNAARHARAARVAVRLRPLGAGRWSLVIEDDGIGLGAADDTGLGLTSMRRRARAIGAALTIGPGALGRGTRVELRFQADAEDRRVLERAARSERRWT